MCGTAECARLCHRSAFLASFRLGSIDNPEEQTVLFAGQPSQGLFFWSEAQDRLVLPFTVPQSLTERKALFADCDSGTAIIAVGFDGWAGFWQELKLLFPSHPECRRCWFPSRPHQHRQQHVASWCRFLYRYILETTAGKHEKPKPVGKLN